MKDKKINIGILGCSAIAERSTIPAILETGTFNLIAIGSRTQSKAENLAAKFGAKGFSYEEVLNNPEIEAVYIPLPSGLHYEWAKKALLAGKHVLLEKPFVESYEKAEELIAIAATKNLIAMEGLTYVYHPLIAKVFELVRSNEIGEIRFVEASFGFPYLPEADIRNNRALGGGAILDNLIYPLSLVIHLLENKYDSFSYHTIEDERYSTDARGFLRFDSKKASAQINYGFGFYYRNCFAIWGGKGIIEVDRAFTRPKDMPGEIILKKDGKEERITVAPANQFTETIRAFYKKITGADKSGSNESADILDRMKIISEMYKAFVSKRSNHG